MGNALKAAVKAGTAHEIGARVEDILEAAQRDFERAGGAISALTEAAKYIQALHEVVDKEIDAGTCDLPTGQKIKQYVTRAVASAETLARKFANLQQVSDGRVQGLKAAVATIKKAHDEAMAQAAVPDSAESSSVSDAPSAPGSAEPPRMTIKQRRLAEERAANGQRKKGGKHASDAR